jgi:hypothetical protein
MEIWYKNLPFIPLFQSYNRMPYSTRYWRNWPTVDNPYIEPGLVYFTLLQMIINLQAPI